LPAENQDLIRDGGNMPGPLGNARSIKASGVAQKGNSKELALSEPLYSNIFANS